MYLKTKELYYMANELWTAPRNPAVFIGLYDRDLDGEFNWGDGEPVTFTMWDTGEQALPDNLNLNEPFKRKEKNT